MSRNNFKDLWSTYKPELHYYIFWLLLINNYQADSRYINEMGKKVKTQLHVCTIFLFLKITNVGVILKPIWVLYNCSIIDNEKSHR